MTEAWMMGLAGVVGGLLGTLLGGVLVWRQLHARLVRDLLVQLRAAMAPLLDARLARMELSVTPAVVAPATAPVAASIVDLEALVLRFGNLLEARFDAQGQTWQALLQRIPQSLQQALQVELDFLAQQQAQRDAAAAQREDEHAAALRTLIGGLAASGAPTFPSALPAGTAAPAASSPVAPRALASPPPAISARPPELLLTPLPRPEPVYDEPEPVAELSDEELDALPPELPVPDRTRKRILPVPKKPVLRKL